MCCCASEAFAGGKGKLGRLHLHLRTAARRCCATSHSRTFQRGEAHGLRHRGLWSRPDLGRPASETGHGDGDNDAGIGTSSSFEHYIRICDEQQRLKLNHAKATFRNTNTSRATRAAVPQCLRRPQDAILAEVPRPAERAGRTTLSAKRRQRAPRCTDMLRRRDHSKGLESHQPR